MKVNERWRELNWRGAAIALAIYLVLAGVAGFVARVIGLPGGVTASVVGSLGAGIIVPVLFRARRRPRPSPGRGS